MSEALFYLDPDSGVSLQSQIRQKLVDGILSGTFPPGTRLPSSRRLADQLGVAASLGLVGAALVVVMADRIAYLQSLVGASR